MKIIVNGKDLTVKENITINQLLKELNVDTKVMAVSVNMNIVKKDQWSHYTPKEGDKLELLHFVGGG